MGRKNKINKKVISLIILVYLAGAVNFNLGLVEMVLDVLIVIFAVDMLTKKPKKKPKKEKKKHCRFWKTCELYDPKIKTCNEDEGFYGSKFAGCYLRLSKLEEKNKKKKK